MLPSAAVGLVGLVALLLMAWSARGGREVRPLIPALRSPWLTVHVFLCMVAYGGLSLGSFACLWILAAPKRMNDSKQGVDLFAVALERKARLPGRGIPEDDLPIRRA